MILWYMQNFKYIENSNAKIHIETTAIVIVTLGDNKGIYKIVSKKWFKYRKTAIIIGVYLIANITAFFIFQFSH